MILFNKCFGCTRFIYNKGVEHFNNLYKTKLDNFKKLSENGCIAFNKEKQCCKKIETKFMCYLHKEKKLKWELPLSLCKLRPLIMNNNKDLTEEEKWQEEIPYDTRQLSIDSLIANIKSCLTNRRNGNIKKFNLTFKSRKDPRQIFFVNKKALNNFNIFKTRLKNKKKLKTRKRYNNYSNYKIEHNCIISKEYNKYYILIPKSRDTKFQEAKYGSVSLDPGVRTFQTYYSPEGICGKIGNKFGDITEKLSSKIDKYKSLYTQIKDIKKKNEKKEDNKKINVKKTKWNIKKRISLLRTKIKNKVCDLHWQSCSFLVKNFQNIIVPKFGSKNMCRKKKRNIVKSTVKKMLSLGHYKFIEKLKFKCKEYQRNLIIETEEYTSQTCGVCGKLNKKLGGSKTFNCPSCDIKIDRDINGARNILIKYFS